MLAPPAAKLMTALHHYVHATHPAAYVVGLQVVDPATPGTIHVYYSGTEGFHGDMYRSAPCKELYMKSSM